MQLVSQKREALLDTCGLHCAIEVHWVDTGRIEFRDRRTDFHLSFESETALFNEAGIPADDLLHTLRQLGFLDDVPIPTLRARQRPFRLQMQKELRDEALGDFLNFTREQVQYYQGNPAYNLEDIQDVAGLQALPILKKMDLRENFDELLARSADISNGLSNGTLRIARTSGTTDERIQIISDMTIDQVPPDYEKVWGVSFNDRTPRTAVLTTPLCSATECHLGKLPLERRIHREIVLYLNSTEDLFSAPEALIRNIAEELWAFHPEILLVNPYYLMWFGREAQRLNLRLPKIDLILTTYQYASKIHKRALATMFEAPVYNSYSATELGGCMLGVECKNGRWHIYENHSIVEIIGQRGEMPPGEIGSVVATVVAGRLMPLIRYEVGDLARIDDIDCDCSLSDWQCFEFHGRQKDTLSFDGEEFTTKQVDDLLAEVGGIDFYRCTQDGESSVTIDVIPSPGLAVPRQEIEEHVRAGLSVGQVRVRHVSRLDPEPSMKFRLTARDASL